MKKRSETAEKQFYELVTINRPFEFLKFIISLSFDRVILVPGTFNFI